MPDRTEALLASAAMSRHHSLPEWDSNTPTNLAPLSPSFPPPATPPKHSRNRPLPSASATPTLGLSPVLGSTLPDLGNSLLLGGESGTPSSSTTMLSGILPRTRKASTTRPSPSASPSHALPERSSSDPSSPPSSSSALFQAARLKLHLVDADAMSKARGLVAPPSGSSSNEVFGPALDASPGVSQLSLPPISPEGAASPSLLAPERSSRDRFRSARRTNTSLQLSLNPTPSVSPTSHPISLSRDASPIRKSPLQTSFSSEDITRRLADHVERGRDDSPLLDSGPVETGLGLGPLRPSTVHPVHPQLGRSALSHEIVLSSGEPSPSEERASYLSRSNSTSASVSSVNRERDTSGMYRAYSEGGRAGRSSKDARRSERATSGEVEETSTREAGESEPTGSGTRPKRSGSTGSTLWRELASTPKSSADYVIAVIGARGVGKSTVIKRAFKSWGLSGPLVLAEANGQRKVSSYSAQVETGHAPRIRSVSIEVLEIDMQVLHPTDGDVNWPKSLPKIDGVMLCYNALDVTSTGGLREVLNTFCTNLPTIVIACKSDPGVPLAIDATTGNEIGSLFGVGLVEVTTQAHSGRQKMKLSFGWMLRAISREMRSRAKKVKEHTAAPGNSVPDGLHTPDSEMSTGTHAMLWEASEERKDGHQPMRQSQRAPPPSTLSTSSSSSSLFIADLASPPASMSNSLHLLAPVEQEKDVTIGESSHRDRLVPVTSSFDNEFTPPTLPVANDSRFVSRSELYDRFLNAVCTGSDNAFVNAFLLIYRRFCRPQTLIRLLSERFDKVEEDDGMAGERKRWTLIRLTSAVSDWTRVYPGDFTMPGTVMLLDGLLQKIVHHTHLGMQAGDLTCFMETVRDLRDLDTSWTMKDGPITPEPELAKTHLDHLADKSRVSSQYSELDDTTLEAIASSQLTSSIPDYGIQIDVNQNPSPVETLTEQSRRSSRQEKQDNSTNGGLEEVLITKRESSETEPVKRSRASSEGSRSLAEELVDGRSFLRALSMFAEETDISIAVELCKIDWELFSQIKPRDCLRHVVGHEKDTRVAACVTHFNRVAGWVSTMVVAHSKPKHRARAYERFVQIAHHLRKLRDYPSLYAVVSGLNVSAISRLVQTHALVRPGVEVEKEGYMTLMSSLRAWQGYRSALASDVTEGASAVPFIGVITQDLTKLEAVHQDLRKEDGAINWTKFMMEAEAMTPLMVFQARGNPAESARSSLRARSLIQDTPILDEDSLSRRSRELETDGTGPRRAKRFVAEAFFVHA